MIDSSAVNRHIYSVMHLPGHVPRLVQNTLKARFISLMVYSEREPRVRRNLILNENASCFLDTGV